jgi:hypothetical protein
MRLGQAYKVNNEQKVAVSKDVYWMPVNSDTPRGTKIQLLGSGGVATYGNYDGDPFWTDWCPLPRKRPAIDCTETRNDMTDDTEQEVEVIEVRLSDEIALGLWKYTIRVGIFYCGFLLLKAAFTYLFLGES